VTIAKLNYSHDAMIDLILAEPWLSQGEIAARFGYSQSWLSIVMSSDVFKDRLAARKKEIVDPTITASVEERFEAIARRSAAVVLEKLEAAPAPDFALKALELSSKALGFGARGGVAVNVNNNTSFVVAMPQKAADGGQWLEQYGGLPVRAPAAANPPQLIEGELRGEEKGREEAPVPGLMG
jgi:hypothetical protein